MALDLLALDRVWWLVSPQNPLKEETDMAPFEARVNSGIDTAKAESRVTVTGIEAQIGTRFTAETLTRLVEVYTEQHFVWMMGADNLEQISSWADWTRIFETVAVAVFARPGYAETALEAEAAVHFADHRIESGNAAELATMTPPAWVYLDIPMHPLSATQIRRSGGF